MSLPPEQEAIWQLLSPHEDAQVQAAVDKLEESADLPIGGTTDPGNNLLGTTTGTEPSDTETTGSGTTTGTGTSAATTTTKKK